MYEISQEIAECSVMMSLIQLSALVEVNNISYKKQEILFFSHFPDQTDGTNKLFTMHIRRKRNENENENACNTKTDILT